MKPLSAVLGAGLAVAALAAPATAVEPTSIVNQNLVYTVTASEPGGAGRLEAGCVFRPDRWTADYGPTYIDGWAATAGVASHTSVTCRIYYNTTTLAGEASAWDSGNVALIQNAREGVTGTRGIRVCVSAFTQYIVDVAYSVDRCVNG